MDVSTPLFLFAVREWASINYSSTAFVQAFPLVVSLLSIAAMWWLVRTIGGRMWTRVLVTSLVAVNPMFVVYSTRIKEYSVEVLLGVLLLIALAKLTQRPTPRRSITLLVLSIVACVTSGALVLFVGGIAVAVAIQGLREGWYRDRYWMADVVGISLAMGVSYVSFYNKFTAHLQQFWSSYEFGGPNSAPVTHTIGFMGNGIAHGLLGTPLQVGPFPYPYALSNAGFEVSLATGIAVFGILLALMVSAVWTSRKQDSAARTTAIAASSVIAIAFFAAAAGHAPFGGGRTDLWWYPAFWSLLAISLESGFRRFAPSVAQLSTSVRRTITIGCSLLLIMVAIPFGMYFRSWYPAQDIRALFSQHQAAIRPTDWVYLSSYNTWSYALYGLGPFHIQFGVQNGKGWLVSVDKFDVQRFVTVEPWAICLRSRRLWWIGINSSILYASSYRLTGPAGSETLASGARELASYGWIPSRVIVGNGVNAILYTHPGACAG